MLTGIVILALPPMMDSSSGDASVHHGTGPAFDVPTTAPNAESTPAQVPSPASDAASKLAACDSEMLHFLSASLTRRVTHDDPQAIFTTDNPALNAAKDEGLAVLLRDLLQ
jgi:hypothetical protein